MTLAEIKPMHGESLYDIDGNLVGKWNGKRGMFSDCFVVRERTCEITAIDDGLDEAYDGSSYSYAPPTYYLTCGHNAYECEPNYCHICGAKVVE